MAHVAQDFDAPATPACVAAPFGVKIEIVRR